MTVQVSATTADQLATALDALAAGAVMGVYYDCFRILRLILPSGRAAVTVQDLFFWITSAVAVFFAAVRAGNGFVQIYFVLLVLIAWAVYFFTVGGVVMFIATTVTAVVKKLIGTLYKRIIRPIYDFILKILESIYIKTKNLLIKPIKKSKKRQKNIEI